jgi:flagellar biosynthesis anti-sigma factor FlgM
VAQRDLGLKDPKDTKRLRDDKGLSVAQDQVTLTSAAKTYASSATSVSDLDKEQAMKVERLKALVDGGNYKIDPHMADSIAENIANMLM